MLLWSDALLLMNYKNVLFNENCLDVMSRLPDDSIDMVFCDLPYGTTQNEWDVLIPFDELWVLITCCER